MQIASSPIRVLCVDDYPDSAMLLEMNINAESDMQSVGCIYQADMLVTEVARTEADVVLLDLTMPGKNPLVALAEVSKAFPHIKIIVFSGMQDPQMLDLVIEAGAAGYVYKSGETDDVIRAIRLVVRGEFALFKGSGRQAA